MESFNLTSFNLGRSTVMTLPKKTGIKPGTPLSVTIRGEEIIVKPRKTTTKSAKEKEIERKLKQVRKLAGGIKGSFPHTPEDLNRMYDEETYGDIDKFLKLKK